MLDNLILNISVPVPIFSTFDYLPPEDFLPDDVTPGVRVIIPFGHHTKVGVVVGVSDRSEMDRSRLKRVKAFLDNHSLLSTTDLQILYWASEYYHHPIGEVVASAFPVPLRKGKIKETVRDQLFCVTEAGRKIADQEFKRAPRQVALLNTIRTHPEGIGRQALKDHGVNWDQPVRELIRKGLVEKTEVLPPNPMIDNTAMTMPELSLNKAQKNAIETVTEGFGKFGAYLLEGVTGSGKTEVYLRLIEIALLRGEQAMVLLPEISLTPQIEARFRERFPVQIAVFHSGLTENQRVVSWLKVQQGKAQILLGTRSAVFTPLKNPGMIILDEEHDVSFKQQDGFRFSGRDFAIMRAKKLSIPVLLGTATPSLETLRNAQTERYKHLVLPERAGGASHPAVKILDIRNQQIIEGLSRNLIEEIDKTIGRKDQALLFLNRRGFAPTLICHTCGWIAKCRNCDSNMVVHSEDRRLRCHHCAHDIALVGDCPHCGTKDLRSLGLGTERVEQALNDFFPSARIVRIDRDSTRRKGSLKAILRQIEKGEIDVMLGTQMLAKGHHFPNVTLVGILDADSGLFSTDFRAPERLAQLIVQVAGRAGREDKAGTVILQTRQPDHPLLLSLIRGGYSKFSKMALTERMAAHLPPFSYQALLRAEAATELRSLGFLEKTAVLARQLTYNETTVLGPVPAPMARRAGNYRYQLLFQSEKRESLHRLLDSILPKLPDLQKKDRVRWSLDVDPVDLY